MALKTIVMLDRESLTGSVKLKATSTQPIAVSFEGETRLAQPVEGMIEEDFYVLLTRLWDGQDKPELYEMKVGEDTITFGLRELGLDAMRGFYLNGRSYPLRKGNVEIVESCAPASVFTKADEEGLCLLVKTKGVEEVASLYNHPSIVGWILPEEKDAENLRATNKIYYGEDKTRPTIFAVPKGMDIEDPALKVADVNLFYLEEGEEELPLAYHKKFPYRCIGIVTKKEIPDERMYLIHI